LRLDDRGRVVPEEPMPAHIRYFSGPIFGAILLFVVSVRRSGAVFRTGQSRGVKRNADAQRLVVFNHGRPFRPDEALTTGRRVGLLSQPTELLQQAISLLELCKLPW
jgi:hypothetical protein